MAIDFPASPTNGQTFVSGSVTYTWDGSVWTAVVAAGDKIVKGNTKAEVIDTGSDGRFLVTAEGTERLKVESTGRLTVSGSAVGTPVALTDGATITADFYLGNNFTVTLGGNRTLANPSNLVAGQSGCIWITQDGTGSRTLSYGSYWDFTGGTAPTLTTTAAAVDCLVYSVQSTTKITATLITNLS